MNKYGVTAWDGFNNKPIKGELVIVCNGIRAAMECAYNVAVGFCEDESPVYSILPLIIKTPSGKTYTSVGIYETECDFGSIILERVEQ